MPHIPRRIDLEVLPVTEDFLPRKRLLQQRGELALIEDGAPFRHLAYFSLKASPGLHRGGHYHAAKTERFYVVSGRIRIACVDMETDERSETIVEAGTIAIVPPLLAHRIEAEEDAQVIEYYDGVYNKDDDRPFSAW